MECLLSKENFLSHLILWKVAFGLAFIAILLFFGDFLASMCTLLQKTEKKSHRYFFSTIFLLILFLILRMLNGAYDMFLTVLHTKGP